MSVAPTFAQISVSPLPILAPTQPQASCSLCSSFLFPPFPEDRLPFSSSARNLRQHASLFFFFVSDSLFFRISTADSPSAPMSGPRLRDLSYPASFRPFRSHLSWSLHFSFSPPSVDDGLSHARLLRPVLCRGLFSSVPPFFPASFSYRPLRCSIFSFRRFPPFPPPFVVFVSLLCTFFPCTRRDHFRRPFPSIDSSTQLLVRVFLVFGSAFPSVFQKTSAVPSFYFSCQVPFFFFFLPCLFFFPSPGLDTFSFALRPPPSLFFFLMVF